MDVTTIEAEEMLTSQAHQTSLTEQLNSAHLYPNSHASHTHPFMASLLHVGTMFYQFINKGVWPAGNLHYIRSLIIILRETLAPFSS